MKYFKIFFLLVAFSATSVAISSCGNNSNKTEQQGKEYTSAYICPMHCEGSGSDEPGKCPVCGMDYVKNDTFTYACPMHPEHTGIKGSKCSECGMDLEEMSTHMLNQNHMQMMMKDSTMMHSMMGNMMNNPKMMGQMMQMMHKEGMMSQECIQSCMKMMSDKGMDMGNMMQDGKMENHESHNH